MFRQVVAHRWAPDADAIAREGFRASMESLREIPELVALRHGDDARIFEGDLDLTLERLDSQGIEHGQPVAGRGGDAVDVPDPDGHLIRIHTLV